MKSELDNDSARWRQVLENDESYSLSAVNGVTLIDESNLLDFPRVLRDSLHSHLIFETSGSSGVSKWVVHRKSALIKHAQLVNTHLGITMNDVLGLVLPQYHVGGFGVIARAITSGSVLAQYREKWSACACVEFLTRENVSVLSLVPTQVVDIVGEELSCPECVRIAVVGGGQLGSDVRDRAVKLGWNIQESYGMTETGSQIATSIVSEADDDNGYLPLIDGWQVRLGSEGMLEVKGECLFEGYLNDRSKGRVFTDPKKDGWFTTSDHVDLLEKEGATKLKFLGRRDQQVKILGELVDVSALENRLSGQLKIEAYLISLPDERRGARLFPVVDHAENAGLITRLSWSGLERLEKPVIITEFPRNEMGKLQRTKLAEAVESIVFSAE